MDAHTTPLTTGFFADFLDHAGLAARQDHKLLSLWPLVWPEGSAPAGPEYTRLADAIAAGAFRVDEVAGGNVPKVSAVNEGELAVLVLFGEEIHGALQNRTVNASFLVPAKSRVVLDVSCVEQGRWSRNSKSFGAPEAAVSSAMRKKMAMSVTRARASGGDFTADQAEVWKEVGDRLRSSRTRSRTSSYGDYRKSRRSDLDEISKSFHTVDRQVGFVASIGDEIVGLECIGRPGGLRTLVPHAAPGLWDRRDRQRHVAQEGRRQAAAAPLRCARALPGRARKGTGAGLALARVGRGRPVRELRGVRLHPRRGWPDPRHGLPRGGQVMRRRRTAKAPVRLQGFEDEDTGFRGWQVELPMGLELPTPCVDESHVYLGGGFGSFEFHAFDRATGQVAWSQHTKDDGPTAATLAGDRVLYNTESCTLRCHDARTGELAWERWLGDPLLAQPAVGEDLVFMAYPGKGVHWLTALDLAEGKSRWNTELEGDLISAPVFAEERIWASTWDGTVACFDPADGRRMWHQDMQATSAPWVWNGEAYVSRRDPDEKGAPKESTFRTSYKGSMRSQRSRRARYYADKRGSLGDMAYKKSDASVGFGAAPSSAKIHLAEKLTGWTSVRSAWRHQGSRPCIWTGSSSAWPETC